jgi:hypothetical protein
MRFLQITLCLFAGLSFDTFWCASLHATNVVWSGLGGDGDWANNANWVGNAPANNDYQDRGVFGATATAGTVTVPAGRKARGIYFETAGWTVGKFADLQDINSAGAGTNSLDFFNLRNVQGTVTWNIATGNTLDLFNGFYGRDQHLIVTGGGTLLLDKEINGYSGPELQIMNATVRMEDDKVYTPSSGFVSIDDLAAVLQLQTTVANALGQIGDGIIDGIGNGLTVNDIGGGFVEIFSTVPPPVLAAAPEPCSLALLSFGCLVLLRRRRSRSSRTGA